MPWLTRPSASHKASLRAEVLHKSSDCLGEAKGSTRKCETAWLLAHLKAVASSRASKRICTARPGTQVRLKQETRCCYVGACCQLCRGSAFDKPACSGQCFHQAVLADGCSPLDTALVGLVRSSKAAWMRTSHGLYSIAKGSRTDVHRASRSRMRVWMDSTHASHAGDSLNSELPLSDLGRYTAGASQGVSGTHCTGH